MFLAFAFATPVYIFILLKSKLLALQTLYILVSCAWAKLQTEKVKYAPSGTVLWAASAGGTTSDIGQSVSTDAGGNVHVTGYFNCPSITFGKLL